MIDTIPSKAAQEPMQLPIQPSAEPVDPYETTMPAWQYSELMMGLHSQAFMPTQPMIYSENNEHKAGNQTIEALRWIAGSLVLLAIPVGWLYISHS